MTKENVHPYGIVKLVASSAMAGEARSNESTRRDVLQCRAIPPSANNNTGRTIHDSTRPPSPVVLRACGARLPEGYRRGTGSVLLTSCTSTRFPTRSSGFKPLMSAPQYAVGLSKRCGGRSSARRPRPSEEMAALLRRIDVAAAGLFAMDDDERCTGGTVKAADRVARSDARAQTAIITIDDTDDEDSEASKDCR
ncbi:hypothetical protein ACHAW5_001977 [Stephanodiscus triporus]|uniref:Uncharacterized protein n=1 Tax=Stephanodiscus triporus TaxID=2934178 RepID=A0ABD3QSD8_9STRA